MRSSFVFMAAIASCILPALGQTGTNCNIVANRTVKAGDSLANIAASANITLDQIQFANPQITNPRSLNIGDVVKIPNSKCVAPAAPALVEPTATCSNGTAKTTTVVSGDTLNVIAKEKLGITLPALLAANPQITNPDAIAVGDVLNIPLCGAGAGVAGPTGGGAAKPTKTKSAGASKTPKPSAMASKGARSVRMKRSRLDDATGYEMI
ncbi:hypothetical protein BKA65DRAFT_550273 [Rhexocercosporidium sp. MPI-PUGE-AT-0058]|nr:hypothetical protein BKA65DRAFT_550273 [Rhexocercosporidium sp. MPI-PUGE-AT-0058]